MKIAIERTSMHNNVRMRADVLATSVLSLTADGWRSSMRAVASAGFTDNQRDGKDSPETGPSKFAINSLQQQSSGDSSELGGRLSDGCNRRRKKRVELQ